MRRKYKQLGVGTILGLVLLLAPIFKSNAAATMTAKTILLNVPFTAQAPYGNWSDQRLEDGCEEASALMAIKWARGETLTKKDANSAILKASDYILKKYGEYRDITTADAVKWIYEDYFNYQKVALKKNVTRNDIIAELKKGNLIIAPMNGQALRNPYYTAPGPMHHMMLIRGYDAAKDQFITNDPGTRRGEAYRYGTKLFFNAIRDYPTGYHSSFKETQKNIIVDWK
jgi:hypothetical protein